MAVRSARVVFIGRRRTTHSTDSHPVRRGSRAAASSRGAARRNRPGRPPQLRLCRGRADGPGFPDRLGTERIDRGRGDGVVELEAREVARPRQRVVHERGGQRLPRRRRRRPPRSSPALTAGLTPDAETPVRARSDRRTTTAIAYLPADGAGSLPRCRGQPRCSRRPQEPARRGSPVVPSSGPRWASRSGSTPAARTRGSRPIMGCMGTDAPRRRGRNDGAGRTRPKPEAGLPRPRRRQNLPNVVGYAVVCSLQASL